MRNALLSLIFLSSVLPAYSLAGGSPRIWGQSRTFHVTLADDVPLSSGQIEVRKALPSEDAYGEIIQSVPFASECTATKREIRCARGGKTVLAGTIYRLTPDGSPRCFGAVYENRYTCIEGCNKDAPRYLTIEPYEC